MGIGLALDRGIGRSRGRAALERRKAPTSPKGNEGLEGSIDVRLLGE